MKNKIRISFIRKVYFLSMFVIYSVGVFFCSNLLIEQSYGQQASHSGLDVPHIISYQGIVGDHNGAPLSDGNYQIIASFYSDPSGVSKIWQGKYAVTVTKGLFNVMLGSGESPLPTLTEMNKPIWVGIQVGTTPEMRPLTQLTSSPYSLNIPDNSVTKEKMGTDYIGKITVNGQEIKGKGAELNISTGAGIQMNYDANNNSLLLQSIAGSTNPTLALAPAGLPPCSFDFVPGTDAIGWGQANTVGTAGSLIGFASLLGGWGNAATGDYSSIVGGASNIANACGSFVGGGGIIAGSCIAPPACPAMPPGPFLGNIAAGISSAVVGGSSNSAFGDFSFDGGGQGNTVNFNYTTVGGGQGNTTNADWAVVGGGHDNIAGSIGGGVTQTVAGGDHNKALGDGATICGGEVNTVNDMHSYIGGGFMNTTAVNSKHSTISGGQGNNTFFDYTTIGGGQTNVVNADYAVVGGGHNNVAGSIGGGITQTVAGGDHNQALGDGAAICGGEQNTVNDMHSYIGGGFMNTTAINAKHSTIGGGQNNTNNTDYTTIGGGSGNTTVTDWAFIGGGKNNIAGAVGLGITQTVGGGEDNKALGDGAAICGGERNTVNDMHSYVGGGFRNTTAIGAKHATISGGMQNNAGADWSTIVGGQSNATTALNSTATGYAALAQQYGQSAQASGPIVANGDAQTSVYVERGVTTMGGGAVNLALDGGFTELAVPANYSMSLRIEIIARDNAAVPNSIAFFVDGIATWQPGPVVCVAMGPQAVFACGLMPATAVAVVPVAGTNLVRITVNSGAPLVNWVARIQTAEVKL